MKRVVKLPEDRMGNIPTYVLQKEYENFGLYQRKCPSGWLVHQDYLITNGSITIQCSSYNNICKDELLDAIDEYIETGKFGLRVFKQDLGLFCVHSNGNMRI